MNKAGGNVFDGKGFYTSKPVVDFCERFDDHCNESIEAVLTKFQVLSQPITHTPDMKAFLDKAPELFGDLWTLMRRVICKE